MTLALAASLAPLACKRGPDVILGHAPPEAPDAGAPISAPSVTTSAPSTTDGGGSAPSERDSGSPAPRAPVFGEAVLLEELMAKEALNPSLTEDQLTLVFNAEGVGDAATSGKDIFIAERGATSEPFGPPTLLETLSTPEFDTSPAISLDGLSLWVGQTVPGSDDDIDVWVSTRASRRDPWPAPSLVPELNTPAKDIPRPLGQYGLVLPLASQRDSDGQYQTYFAIREAHDAAFARITQAPLEPLQRAGYELADPFLSHDGLTLYFADHSQHADLYVAFRDDVDEPFDHPLPLDSINTEADERDPWLSPDATTLYFVSDRTSDKGRIFRATRVD